MARLAPAYQPRRPTETVLYRAVRENLETFLAHARGTYERPLPRYVEQELRAYLRCGVFAHGFIRCHCDACGHDLLVAYSCKGRGICPSCCGRRMANSAAHLVDRVLPDVPVRQFVLSLPYELRRLAAFKPDVLGALVRIFVDAVLASYRARALRDGWSGGQGGAVAMLQRFGGSLNLNLHMHVLFVDGVFTRDEQMRVHFHAAPAPERAELDVIARRVHARVVVWLRRHGYLAPTPLESSLDPPVQDAMDACGAIAMQRGLFVKLATEEDEDAATPSEPSLRFSAEHQGFNLHAGVRIDAGDDLGRERLCRYGLRPPLALPRLRRLPDGRIALRVKYARAGKAKHRVMTPLEFLARISAIIPPPRFPLVRFHGVFAPRSSWRADVVPRPRGPRPCPTGRVGDATQHRYKSATPSTASPAEHPRAQRRQSLSQQATSSTAAAQSSLPSVSAIRTRPATEAREAPPSSFTSTLLTPSVLSVSHWDRLQGGLLCAVSPRIHWAELMRRTFEVDVQQCPKCLGRLRVLAHIDDPEAARLILEHLGMPSSATTTARARDPTDTYDLAQDENVA